MMLAYTTVIPRVKSFAKTMLVGATLLGVLGLAITTPVLPHGTAQPLDAQRVFDQGVSSFSRGDIPNSILYFQQAIQMDPAYVDAHYNLGSVFYKNHQYREAASEFARVLELHPGDSQARYSLALCYEQVKDFNQAVQMLEQIPPNDPKYSVAQAKLSRLRPLARTQTAASGTASTTSSSTSSPTSSTTTPAKVESFAKGFFGPTGMALSREGLLFVANYSKNAIYRINRDGTKTTIAEGDGLMGPMGMVMDAKTGQLYVANYLKNNVVQIDPNGGKITVLATGLKKPYNLLLDPLGHVLYVSEQETNTVSRIRL